MIPRRNSTLVSMACKCNDWLNPSCHHNISRASCHIHHICIWLFSCFHFCCHRYVGYARHWYYVWLITFVALRWRHNGRDSVSNHQPHDCLLNRLFRRRSKKTSKLRVTGLCVGNSPHKWPVTRKMFPFDDVIMGNLGHQWAGMPHLRHICVCVCVPLCHLSTLHVNGDCCESTNNFRRNRVIVSIKIVV